MDGCIFFLQTGKDSFKTQIVFGRFTKPIHYIFLGGTRMAEWKNDKELFEIMKKELYTGVLCDMLDTLGYSHVCLPNRLQPLYADRIMIGRAYPTHHLRCIRRTGNPAWPSARSD